MAINSWWWFGKSKGSVWKSPIVIGESSSFEISICPIEFEDKYLVSSTFMAFDFWTALNVLYLVNPLLSRGVEDTDQK